MSTSVRDKEKYDLLGIRDKEKYELKDFNFNELEQFISWFDDIFEMSAKFKNKSLNERDFSKLSIYLKLFATLELMVQLNGLYESYRKFNPNEDPISGFCTVKSLASYGKILLCIDFPKETDTNKNFRGKNLYDVLPMNQKKHLVHFFFTFVSLFYSILKKECIVEKSELVSSIKNMTIYAKDKKLYGFIDKLYQEVGKEWSFTQTNQQKIDFLTNEELVFRQFETQQIHFGKGIFRLIILHFYFTEHVLFNNSRDPIVEQVNVKINRSTEESKEVAGLVIEPSTKMTWCQKASPKKEEATVVVELEEKDDIVSSTTTPIIKTKVKSIPTNFNEKLLVIKSSLDDYLNNFFKTKDIEEQLSKKLSGPLMVIVKEIMKDMNYFLKNNISFNIYKILKLFETRNNPEILNMRISNQINNIDITYLLINNIEGNIKLIELDDPLIVSLIKTNFIEIFKNLGAEIIELIK